MGFTDIKKTGRVDHVEEALNDMASGKPEEYKAAIGVLQDRKYTAPEIAKAFRELGYNEAGQVGRVKHWRYKTRNKAIEGDADND